MLQQSEKQLVEVADLKQRPSRKKRRQRSRLKPWLCMLFGLALAISWHFIHLAGEIYQPTPADPQFWYHLAVEGAIALYAAGFSFIVWTLWERFSR